MISERLNKSPGFVRISRIITWSLVLVFPFTVILFILACCPSLILISKSISLFSVAVSIGSALKNKYPSSKYKELKSIPVAEP